MIIWFNSRKSIYEIGNLLFCSHSKVAYWKNRFNSGGIESLTAVERPGRPRSIDGRAEEEIRTKLSGSDHWKTSKTSRIVQERSGVTYTRRHVRRMAKAWGYSLTTPRKKHKNSVSLEEVEKFKKNRKGMTAVCMDESVFVYDSAVRKVWAKNGNKPRITTTVSHMKIFEFGTVALDGSTLFRSYESMNLKIFIRYLNTLKREYRRFVLFYDDAP